MTRPHSPGRAARILRALMVSGLLVGALALAVTVFFGILIGERLDDLRDSRSRTIDAVEQYTTRAAQVAEEKRAEDAARWCASAVRDNAAQFDTLLDQLDSADSALRGAVLDTCALDVARVESVVKVGPRVSAGTRLTRCTWDSSAGAVELSGVTAVPEDLSVADPVEGLDSGEVTVHLQLRGDDGTDSDDEVTLTDLSAGEVRTWSATIPHDGSEATCAVTGVDWWPTGAEE